MCALWTREKIVSLNVQDSAIARSYTSVYVFIPVKLSIHSYLSLPPKLQHSSIPPVVYVSKKTSLNSKLKDNILISF